VRKTEILEVAGRKLAPFMFLFGLYLVTYGDTSPGGGFQGGVVIASGVIVIALGTRVSAALELFPYDKLALTEAIAFFLLILVGISGVLLGAGFLASSFGPGLQNLVIPGNTFLYVLNLLIGLKVAVGTSLICLHLFGESE
jgi:multicomponent Na+:H+ antiporter subunit B